MPNRKSKPEGQSGGRRARKSPFLWRLGEVFFTPPGWDFALIAGFAAFIYWRWAVILSWANFLTQKMEDFASSIGALLGWGLALIIMSLWGLVWVVSKRKVASIIHHGNYWLGAIAFTLSAWGGLALIGHGGSFGNGITGQADFVGGLRVAGLAVLGVILVIPRLSFRALKAF